MATHAAFLSDIVEHPEDDAPRLVYADFLDEHGEEHEAARAAFIRDQVELARMDETDERYPALLARVRRSGMLTLPRRRPMVDHVPGGQVMFRRGFVAGVEISPTAFVAQPSEAWRGVPFEQLRLAEAGNKKVAWKALGKRPELARLRTLDFPHGRAADLRALLEGPHLAGLRALTITTHDYEQRGAFARLVRGLDLPALDSLSLREVPSHSKQLVLPKGRPPLRRLHLVGTAEDNGYDEEGPTWSWEWPDLAWLLQSRHGKSLECVSVRQDVDHIHRGVYVAPVPLGRLGKALASSRLGHLLVEGAELEKLLALPSWGAVRHLEVQGYIHPGPLARLVAAPQARELQSIQLSPSHRASIRSSAALPLEGEYWPNLRNLSLDGDLPRALLSGPHAARLLRLEVRDSPGALAGWGPGLLDDWM